MAIKIAGSTIIDDSRNIVSAGVATATEYDITGSTNTLTAGGLSVGVATATTLRVGSAVTINSGIVTAVEYDILGSTNTLTAGGLSVGVATVGSVRINSGIVTATTGIVTYYGDGSYLTGVAAAGAGGASDITANLFF
jgi:hypothetical protein